MPAVVADAEDGARVPTAPPVRPGGLRADESRDFRLEVTTELCRAPADAVLTCLRDLDVLDEPLQALTRLRALDRRLREQHGDRHRVEALTVLNADLVENYGNG